MLSELERTFWLVRESRVNANAALNLEYALQPGNIHLRRLVLKEMPCPSDLAGRRVFRRRLYLVGEDGAYAKACLNEPSLTAP